MESKIIELLSSKMNSNLTVKEIAEKLNVKVEEITPLITMLEENGIIFLNKGEKYNLVSKSSLKKGIIKVTKRKGAIVVLEDDKKTELDLMPNSQKKVLHNDIVLVEPYKQSGKAQLVKVLKTNTNYEVGEVVVENDQYILVFKENQKRIKLSKKYPVGTRLLVDSKTNVIKQEVGHKDDPDIRIKQLLLENNFKIGFNEEYLEELKAIPDELTEEVISEEKANGRLDIRKVDMVTIDGEDTKDFDDAVCFANNTFIVAIADTTSTIKEDSIIDKTTIERGISVYPPGMVEPMIAHKISNGICSLNPYEDRLAVGSISRFKNQDEQEKAYYEMPLMIINSKKKMTYEDVNKYLEDGIIVPGYEKYTTMLKELYDLAMKQKKKMLNEGFLEFSSLEVKIAFEDNKVVFVKERRQGKAEELIEFSMLYHNLLMTNEFIKRNLPYIARNHEEPISEKVTSWNNLLLQRGYKVENKKKYTNEDIKKSLSSYKDVPEKKVLDSIGIKTQSKAKYSAYNKGHFALGQKAYGTFTSPIRRLSDYINQRIYVDALKYGNTYARNKWEPRMERLAKIATDAELRADKVEREADKIRIAEYMNSKYQVNDKFTGIISSITTNYIEVLLPNMIYGRVYYNNNIWYLSKDSYSLTNINDEKLLVGDYINVHLRKVNLDTGEILLGRDKYKEYKNEEKKGKKKVKSR